MVVLNSDRSNDSNSASISQTGLTGHKLPLRTQVQLCPNGGATVLKVIAHKLVKMMTVQSGSVPNIRELWVPTDSLLGPLLG